MPDTVQADIKNSEVKKRSLNLNMTDGKFVSSFNYEKGMYGSKDYENAYYQKIFDTWEEFAKYSKLI